MALQNNLQKGLLASLKSLFSTGDYSDLTVIAGKQYRLHRSLICERSRPLAATCKYNQANKSAEHENTIKDVLDLTDDDPHAIDCMLQFFYHLNYDPPELIEFGPVAEGANLTPPLVLVLHARIYAVAEKYMVDGLKALAIGKFEKATASGLNKHDFLEAAREAYTSTIDSDRGLRDIVVKVFHAHKLPLLDKEEAVQFLTEVPLLAVHLLSALTRDVQATFDTYFWVRLLVRRGACSVFLTRWQGRNDDIVVADLAGLVYIVVAALEGKVAVVPLV